MADVLSASTPITFPSNAFYEKDPSQVIQIQEISTPSDSDSDSEPEGIKSSTSTSTPTPDSPALDFNANHLISSPYPDAANQLLLDGLDMRSRLFAFALTALQPARDDYATAPYLDAFNWGDVFALLRKLSAEQGQQWAGEHEFYVVVFRSQLAPGIDRVRLGELDQRAHQEACASGGLLKYWFGSPNAERRNLATCLWRNHDDAVAGGKGPWHAQCRVAARTMYERIDFHVHRLVVEAGAETWRLEKYR